MRSIKVKFKETTILPRIIPREEIEQLLNYMYSCGQDKDGKEDRFWLRDIAVVEVFFAIGARVYEISNIRADCIDLKSGWIRIMGKGGKERCVQIGDESVLSLLNQYYSANETAIKKSGFFCKPNGKPVFRAVYQEYDEEIFKAGRYRT